MAQDRARNRLLRGLARFRLLSFLPLFIVAAYWIQDEAILFVVSFMFPLLMAFQEIATGMTPRARPAVDHPKTAHRPIDRASMMAALDHFLTASRYSRLQTAVVLLDIDRFSTINDRFGNRAGDEILSEIETRLLNAMRTDDIVLRLGGNRFVVIPRPVLRLDGEQILLLADRLKKIVTAPITSQQITLHLTASVGTCLSTRATHREAEAIFTAAEQALVEAKRAGTNATRTFTPKMRQRAKNMRSFAKEIDAALATAQIRPWFQPQICTETGEVAGFEALARWEHPSRGLVLPDTFMPIIEAAGQTDRLSHVMLNAALSAMQSWERAGFRIPSVAVNFSLEDLRNPKLVEKIKWEVDRFNLPPSRLSVEILEDVVSSGADDIVVRNLQGLAAFGVGIDLDDFGTGQTAIANIRRFAVSRVKIDRSLVSGIDQDPDQQAVIAAILGLVETLGLEALTEGVETAEERAILASLGCRYVQGFGIARAMPLEDSFAWLTDYGERLSRGRIDLRKTG